jgi:hypothetical protein
LLLLGWSMHKNNRIIVPRLLDTQEDCRQYTP